MKGLAKFILLVGIISLLLTVAHTSTVYAYQKSGSGTWAETTFYPAGGTLVPFVVGYKTDLTSYYYNLYYGYVDVYRTSTGGVVWGAYSNYPFTPIVDQTQVWYHDHRGDYTVTEWYWPGCWCNTGDYCLCGESSQQFVLYLSSTHGYFQHFLFFGSQCTPNISATRTTSF